MSGLSHKAQLSPGEERVQGPRHSHISDIWLQTHAITKVQSGFSGMANELEMNHILTKY